MNKPFSIVLYSGPHCCLCDDAAALLSQVAPQLKVDKVDVKSNHDLFHLYGARIPVIKRLDNGAELGWPFDAQGLSEFLS